MKSWMMPAFICLATLGVCSAADDRSELAVVVNKNTPIATISSGDLRLIILGEKSRWPDGEAAIAVETPPDTPETTILVKIVTKMSDAALKRYYMLAAFTGKEIAPPKGVDSAAALKKFVASTPGSVGCILVSSVDDSIKVLKVDGTAPGDSAYKLR